MDDTPNVAVVRRLYEANGDPDVVAQTLHDDVVWDAAPGMPHGGARHGLKALIGDFFVPLFSTVADWRNVPETWFEADDQVIVLGRYEGRAIETGKPFEARFAHVWTLRDGRIAHLFQTADTVQLTRALAA